nr:MAG TPA: hypothetical protein [Bacteriophage sp.]
MYSFITCRQIVLLRLVERPGKHGGGGLTDQRKPPY